MRQNQFLGGATGRRDPQIQTASAPELLSVELTSTVRDAIETMNSQVSPSSPYSIRGTLVGSLSESALSKKPWRLLK